MCLLLLAVVVCNQMLVVRKKLFPSITNKVVKGQTKEENKTEGGSEGKQKKKLRVECTAAAAVVGTFVFRIVFGTGDCVCYKNVPEKSSSTP